MVTNILLLVAMFFLVIYLIMQLLPTTGDKFVSDVTKIQLKKNNELLAASCMAAKTDLKTPSVLSPTIQAIIYMINSVLPHPKKPSPTTIPSDSCDSLSPDQIASLSAPFSISKLQAEQFYLNNSIIINQIYKDQKTLKCFRNFVNIIVKLEGYSSTQASLLDALEKASVTFVQCFTNLNNVEKENMVNLIVNLVGSVVESGPRKVLIEKLLKY